MSISQDTSLMIGLKNGRILCEIPVFIVWYTGMYSGFVGRLDIGVEKPHLHTGTALALLRYSFNPTI